MLCNVECIDEEFFTIEFACLRSQFDDKATLICECIPPNAQIDIRKCGVCDNVSLSIFAYCDAVNEQDMQQLAEKISNALEEKISDALEQ